MPVLVPRSPWQTDFPDVVVHTELRARNAHPAYAAAKSGDADAADKLVRDLLAIDSTKQLARMLSGEKPIILGVTADEVGGFNAIPDAMAEILAEYIGTVVAAGTIIQANKVGHTRADGWHCLVTPAVFNSDVVAGANYVLVDDHVGFGGTLANLRGFIEHNGGHVLCMTTLTETRDARHIAASKETLDLLQGRHGQELDHFWRDEFGHGTDSLTNIEAGYLCRVESVAAIKARMAQAAELARSRGLSPIGLFAGQSVDHSSS